jgi:hypothetical protein
MNHPSDRSESPAESSMDLSMETEMDLLYQLLDSRSNYPWNPQDPESERLLADSDVSWSEAETADAIASGWQTLSAQLDSFWAQQSQGTEGLVDLLAHQFSSRMPRALLQQIARQAAAVAQAGQPMMEQLLQCTQDVLGDWNVDDLQVLARPLAYSLRDGRGEVLDLHLRSIRQAEWSSLSSIEQARLSLAIASFALQKAREIEQ